ncbi:hypothetical protein GGX14DRAFT_399525 [Mycena pura]|uniref:MIF4G domain-containing protein n=1 Tax=Mycena pura TaxID=153505 RepID=A0AAD6YAI0_9AGAR|nr:hypothetical protein GGX14DRAFT_399525 [Mycena pura]
MDQSTAAACRERAGAGGQGRWRVRGGNPMRRRPRPPRSQDADVDADADAQGEADVDAQGEADPASAAASAPTRSTPRTRPHTSRGMGHPRPRHSPAWCCARAMEASSQKGDVGDGRWCWSCPFAVYGVGSSFTAGAGAWRHSSVAGSRLCDGAGHASAASAASGQSRARTHTAQTHLRDVDSDGIVTLRVVERALDGATPGELLGVCEELENVDIAHVVKVDNEGRKESRSCLHCRAPHGHPVRHGGEVLSRAWYVLSRIALHRSSMEQLCDRQGTAEATNEDPVLYSDEYYAAQKAKRQGLGLIKFIGELCKLQMLTERIMHECVKKLLGNVKNQEEETESLCNILTTVGSLLDTSTPKARAHLDVYFCRMNEQCKSNSVGSQMQFMLQDVIELRERKWAVRSNQMAATTIAAVHEAFTNVLHQYQTGTYMEISFSGNVYVETYRRHLRALADLRIKAPLSMSDNMAYLYNITVNMASAQQSCTDIDDHFSVSDSPSRRPPPPVRPPARA